jgi:hypothetical protein
MRVFGNDELPGIHFTCPAVRFDDRSGAGWALGGMIFINDR